ncbi:MAG: phage tail protein, partial [Chloroflexi bacterium]
MARAVETDPYHKFRFHLVDPAGGNLDPVAGFISVTMPDVSIDAVPYREGLTRWTQKYPGIPTVSDITLTKGIFKRDSDFYVWILKCINGGEDYRTELLLNEFHISDEWGINGSPSRVTRLREVFPTSVKPTDDKESSTPDIAIQTMTL